MIVSGTGHRPAKLGGYSDVAFNKLTLVARTALTVSAPTKVVSGMALGWDQALARAATELAIPFVAAVPFDGFHQKWPQSSKSYFHWLLSKADEVVYVCEPGYAPYKLHQRNIYLVDNCDLLLAMFSGAPGGTKNCLDYAESVGRKVKNLYSIWSSMK